MNPEDEKEIRERVSSIESDIKWLKWVAMAAAAASVSDLFVSAPATTAILLGAGVFVVGIITDLVVHLR